MKTTATQHWLQAIQAPPKRGDKNRRIGRLQELHKAALRAETKRGLVQNIKQWIGMK